MIGLSIAPLLTAFSGQPQAAAQLPTERLQAELRGYEEVLKREPENTNALRNIVSIHMQLREPNKAIPALEKLVALDPKDSQVGLLLGRLKLQAGDKTGSVALFRRLHTEAPKDPTILQELVNAEVEAGNARRAISLLQKQIKEQPQDVDLILLLASVYTRDNQLDEALKIYDQAIAKDPSDFRPVLGKAIALFSNAEDEETRNKARALLADATRLAPQQQRPQIEQLAQLYAAGQPSP